MFILRYLVKCHGCGAEELQFEQRCDNDKEQERVNFALPSGWHEGARDHYYCPKHVVVVAVMVDGKPA
jgi:hypothetical protein